MIGMIKLDFLFAKVVRFGYRSDGTNRLQPYVLLKGVTRTDTTFLIIEIKGFMSAEAAKAAALEVISNLQKSDFSQVTKGK